MRTKYSTYRAVPVEDGAGVKLKRVFGYRERYSFDPFLLLDHFGSDNPADYISGFPWHPHRGMETVTYLVSGKVEHADSMGNKGCIDPGDLQWMTAGSGIIHQEMPKPGLDGRTMEGFQVWINLRSDLKMTKPRYRAIESASIPRVETDGVKIDILAGEFLGVRSATPDLFQPIRYLVVRIDPGKSFTISIPDDQTIAVYVFRGAVSIGTTKLISDEGCLMPAPAPLRRASGADGKAEEDTVVFLADAKKGVSLLFLSGTPLGEPIAWSGPIVMNTRSELELAFEDYEKSRFIKSNPTGI